MYGSNESLKNRQIQNTTINGVNINTNINGHINGTENLSVLNMYFIEALITMINKRVHYFSETWLS